MTSLQRSARRPGYIDWVSDGMESTALDKHGMPRRPELSKLLADRSVVSIAAAHVDHGYSMTEIAVFLGVHRVDGEPG